MAHRSERRPGGVRRLLRLPGHDGVFRRLLPAWVLNRLRRPGAGRTGEQASREQVQARDERARYSRQLRGLAELSLAIHSKNDVPELLRAVAERTRELTGARQAAVRLFVDDHPLEVSVPEDHANWRRFYESDAEAVYETVRDRQQSVRLDEARLEADTLWARLRSSPMRGLLATPIVGPSEESIGVIIASDPLTEGFTETDEAILVQIAQMTAIAVENFRLVQRLARMNDERQEQTRLVLEATETERRRIARELHDELGQLATGAKLRLEALRRHAPGYLTDGIDGIRGLIERLTAAIRQESFALQPRTLDAQGLGPALRELFEMQREQTGLHVRLDSQGLDDRRFSRELETTAYRIVQEALTNIIRHSGSREAHVRLHVTDSELRLEIEDPGHGFDVRRELPQGSTGLEGMQERALLLDGELSIDSVPGRGTVIHCILPMLLRKPEDEPARK